MSFRKALLLTTAIAALGALASARGAPACPESCVVFSWRSLPHCTTASELDTLRSAADCYDRAAFNVPEGTLASETGAGFNNCWCTTTVTDEFRVEGVPAGTPLALEVTLDVHAYSSGYGGCYATLTAPDGSTSDFSFVPPFEYPQEPMSKDTTLIAALSVIAGEPFQLGFEVRVATGGEAGGSSSGRWSFDGLPPGSAIVSCKGYYLAAVQARSVSWGRLKGIYR